MFETLSSLPLIIQSGPVMHNLETVCMFQDYCGTTKHASFQTFLHVGLVLLLFH